MTHARLIKPQEGASRSRERSDRGRLAEPRGTGVKHERPYEGGPTGTTDFVCGGGEHDRGSGASEGFRKRARRDLTPAAERARTWSGSGASEASEQPAERVSSPPRRASDTHRSTGEVSA